MSGKKQSHDVRLSKSLSHLLRHGAPKERIEIHPGGYLEINKVLGLPRFKNYTLQDIVGIVEENDKQRFSVKTDDSGRVMIRANQGHTFPVDESELLVPIISPDDYPVVIHGTYRRFWGSISESGLSRKNRNHIHFAPGEPGSDCVISGMRASAEIYVYIDLKKAIEDGIKFYRSSNNVVLSPGNEFGLLHPKYFLKVKDIKRNTILVGVGSSPSPVRIRAVNPEGVLVSGSDNGGLRFVNWKTGYNFQRAQSQVQPGSMDAEAGQECRGAASVLFCVPPV